MITNHLRNVVLVAGSMLASNAYGEDVLTGAMAWQVQMMRSPNGTKYCQTFYNSNSVAAGGKYSIIFTLGAEGVFVIHYSGRILPQGDVTFTLDKQVISKRPISKRFEDDNMHTITFGMNTPSFVNAFIPNLERKKSQSLTFSVGDRQFYAPVHGFWDVSRRMGECHKQTKS